MNEELLNENLFIRLNNKRQSELIGKHCASIEEKIRAARSRTEAESITKKACKEFGIECSSKIVKKMLTDYINRKLNQYWF